MARVSTKENKNLYHTTREALELTRETASELLGSISPERIEKIENERCFPHPDEVLVMAESIKDQAYVITIVQINVPLGKSMFRR